MSTKIYNGYRMDECSFGELIQRCIKAKENLETLRADLLRGMLTITNKGDIVDQYMKFQDRSWNIKRSGLRDPAVDFTINASFFAPLNGKILVLIFDDKKPLHQALVKELGLEYYGYWNNTDPDEDVSLEEFEQRGKDWDTVMESGVPSEYSMNFEFLGYSLPWLDDVINLEEIPDKK